MEVITGAILAGTLYDMLKSGISLTASNIKEKLQGWLIKDTVAIEIEKELNKLQISNDMSQSEILKKISVSSELVELIKEIKPNTTIVQSHSGTGDNIAGNKIINH
ncbi:MAG: hypothetical protein H6936_10635 [Burkholderiales bacterium]|nr:hypothetical protein [Burkholderiales bacterium]